MSWMKTIATIATSPNAIRVPRPYETTPNMPAMTALLDAKPDAVCNE
jgi:hypothetical protein